MNGRVYDPLIGRFGTPDPMTESPYSTQGWNRYSYVGNSPLNFTDPSGYCFMGCFWQKPFKALGKLLRNTPIIGNILTVAAGVLCAPAGLSAVCSSVASAVVTGLASGDLGQALKAGLISAVTAGAFHAAGTLTTGLSPLANIAAHAAVGCGSAVASGGKCGPGALSAGVSSFAGHILPEMGLEKNLVARATVGGLASVAGGGKFGNGAVTAAFGYLFNDVAHQCKSDPTACRGNTGAIYGPGNYGGGMAGLGIGLGIGALYNYIVDTLGLSGTNGTATIFQNGQHVSILVSANGGNLHSKQIVLPDKTTTIAVATDVGNPILTVALPNAGAALTYSQQMLGQNTGPYNALTNSCVTYCGNVLQAGGVEVPRTTIDIIRDLKGRQ